MRDKLGRFVKGLKRPDDFEKKRIEGMMGHIVSTEAREKSRQSQLGRKLTLEHRKKLSLAKMKGDKLGYQAIHKLVRRIKPIPLNCEFCGKSKKLQLANMTGVYDINPDNYKYLCSKCHVYHDGTIFNLKHKNMNQLKHYTDH